MCGWFRYPNSIEHKLVYFLFKLYDLANLNKCIEMEFTGIALHKSKEPI